MEFLGSPIETRRIGGATVAWRYGEYRSEYDSLRSQTALFDHSGIGLLKLTGAAMAFLQRVLARDVEFLTPDRCLTSLLLTEDGSASDIVTVYLLDDFVLLETAVGRGEETLRTLLALADGDVNIRPVNSELRLIGVEGPYAWGAVGAVLSPSVTALPYEAVTELDWRGHSVIFARSGFTAEYGYKVFVPTAAADQLWSSLMEHGQPVGQEVLQAAMLEVRQPVLHLECGQQDVLESGLGWLVDSSKESFVGRDSLLARFARGTTTATVGVAASAGTALEPGAPVYAGDVLIGHIVCSALSPNADALLALARVERDYAAADLSLSAGAAPGQPLRSLASPYVTPGSWSTPVL